MPVRVTVHDRRSFTSDASFIFEGDEPLSNVQELASHAFDVIQSSVMLMVTEVRLGGGDPVVVNAFVTDYNASVGRVAAMAMRDPDNPPAERPRMSPQALSLTFVCLPEFSHPVEKKTG